MADAITCIHLCAKHIDYASIKAHNQRHMDLFGRQSVPSFPVRRFEPEKPEFVSTWTPRRNARPATMQPFSIGRFVKDSAAAQGVPVVVEDTAVLAHVASVVTRAS